jgi:hypothetical protein
MYAKAYETGMSHLFRICTLSSVCPVYRGMDDVAGDIQEVGGSKEELERKQKC